MLYGTTIDAIEIERRARAMRAEVTRSFFARIAARLRGVRLPEGRAAHA